MDRKVIFVGIVATIALCVTLCVAETKNEDAKEENVVADPKKLEYAKGSLCGYCDYCKFCTLCDKDCPCEKSASKPNCHMCKYCKYCKFCSVLCDTICQPGGILDTVSSAIVNSLPSINTAEVDEDLDGVKDWLDKEEL